MKNNYTGMRERILHSDTVEEAEKLFGSLGNNYPKNYVARLKRALERCQARLKKDEPVRAHRSVKHIPVEPAPIIEWHPGDDSEDGKPIKKYKHHKK